MTIVTNGQVPADTDTDTITEPLNLIAELTAAGINVDVKPGIPATTAGPGRCNPYKPTPRALADGGTAWSAAFRHPISGAQTARVFHSEDEAWKFSQKMFDLWVQNGRPQALSTKLAYDKSRTKGKAGRPPKQVQLPPEIEEDESPFDPAIARLWGKSLTVTMIGLDEKDQPTIVLRDGKQTWTMKVVGYKP